MQQEELIITLKSLQEYAIKRGKEANKKSIKDLYFGKALAYSDVLKLMEAATC